MYIIYDMWTSRNFYFQKKADVNAFLKKAKKNLVKDEEMTESEFESRFDVEEVSPPYKNRHWRRDFCLAFPDGTPIVVPIRQRRHQL